MGLPASKDEGDIQQRQRSLPYRISLGDTFDSPLRPSVSAATFLISGQRNDLTRGRVVSSHSHALGSNLSYIARPWSWKSHFGVLRLAAMQVCVRGFAKLVIAGL
jgi:hypothetical protein